MKNRPLDKIKLLSEARRKLIFVKDDPFSLVWAIFGFRMFEIIFLYLTLNLSSNVRPVYRGAEGTVLWEPLNEVLSEVALV